MKCQELKVHVFKSLIDYFRNVRVALDISAAEINSATGTQMCLHWFSEGQRQLPRIE